ncbi:Cubilin like [Pseudolycoriella hygida]|uniref:Cubilin like n=1 Tax=Pseudolycoriella hygida TaxID=35572 RepID=A0A9Q0S2W9_9DIPT|nr:Cubilin like [Pseudolycoriella hygida]
MDCGGMFKVRSLSFTSPNYPQNYASNLYCEWFLQVEDNHRLSLSFDDFDTEANCQYDSVKIYDGFEKKDNNLLANLCGNEIPKTIYNTSDNKMLVVMQTDDSTESKGFSAKFKTACGGTLLINESGTIEMNSFFGIDDSSCNWTLTAPRSDQHVTVTILRFNQMGVATSCPIRILFFDGLNTEARLLKEICDEGHPPPIISNGNALTLSVIGTHPFHDIKLVALYSPFENICGGKFSDLNGQVASPSYPKSYPNNVECVWELSASPGNRLILTLEKMDIELSENCHEDYLEIRENDVSGKLIGVYCGKDVPSVFPQAERFWLKFRSSSDGVGGGFLAQYAYAKKVEIDGTSGTITSPLYPHVFSQYESSFFYRIIVRHENYISIVMKEILLRSERNILIYDGYDVNAPIVAESEIYNSEKFVSSSNVVVILVGSENVLALSFKLEWNEVSQKRQETKNDILTTNCTENSIVNVHYSHVNINSPGFPYGYAANLNCTWILKPISVDRHVVFLFEEIDLEDTANCLSDYVKVYTSNDLSNYKLLNTTCKIIPHSVPEIHGNPYLKINFVSDYYTNRTGFLGVATAVSGSPMNGPSGVIKASSLDSSSAWSITVRRGRTIKFEFLKFDFPDTPSTHCRSYVSLKNGGSLESPYLGRIKYCGIAIPTLENTSSNRAYVVYEVDDRQEGWISFTLRYEEVTYDCGGPLIFNGENSTIIHTPNYPNIPHPHIECVWTVFVPSGELIQVNFIEQFDIKNSKACEEEYVELTDGGTVSGNLIGKFCGQMPPTQYSSSNMLRIKYYTDTTMPMNGFKANISLAKCGGYYRYKSGVIQSSHYPGLGAYEKNSICEYHLNVGSDVMNLTFVDLHLPSADNCSTTDHVEIYSVLDLDANSNESTLDEIGRYCGSKELPPSIFIRTTVLVRFVTMNGNNLHRGFRIAFSAFWQRCGGEVRADTGFITNLGYPNSRLFQQHCTWQIIVPKGRRVKAEMLDFDLGDSELPKLRSYNSIMTRQCLTFYNDLKCSCEIKMFLPNETSETVYSSSNKMCISLMYRSLAGHRGLKLKFSSNEPTVCAGNFDFDEGIIETPKNVSTYYCEYERDHGKPLRTEENNVGTLAIYITESPTISASLCYHGLPIEVQYLPGIWQSRRVFFKECNVSSEFPPIASPFQQTKVITKKGGYYSQAAPYTINYRNNKCGKLIRNTQEVVVRNPHFAPNYGRVACAWQYTTVENALIAHEFRPVEIFVPDYLRLISLSKLIEHSPSGEFYSSTEDIIVH